MRFAKESGFVREAKVRGHFGASRAFSARYRNGRRADARAIARVVCRGAGRQRHSSRFCGNAGVSCWACWSPFVLAARGKGRATGQSLSAGAGGSRDRSRTNDAGRPVRSGRTAARGSRRGSLRFGGCRGDRVVAQPPRARSDGEPAVGTGGRSFGCHNVASAGRGRARAQRGTNTLERSRRAFHGLGSRCTRSTFLHGRVAASARPSGWRHLASGMGS